MNKNLFKHILDFGFKEKWMGLMVIKGKSVMVYGKKDKENKDLNLLGNLKYIIKKELVCLKKILY